jgi:hypothetical protein
MPVPDEREAKVVREQQRATAALPSASWLLRTKRRRLVRATLVIALPMERQPARSVYGPLLVVRCEDVPGAVVDARIRRAGAVSPSLEDPLASVRAQC